MSARTLLIELGTEELPPTSLKTLAVALHDYVVTALDNTRIEHGDTRWLAAPRRLALVIESLSPEQPESTSEKLGPAVTAAFKADGTPTPAAEGFARGCGVSVDQLERVQTDKGERLAFRQTVSGQATEVLLGDILTQALAALPIAKRMRWGASRTEFVRPAHWLVMLYGEQVVDAEVLGLQAGRQTRGHRIHGEQRIDLPNADAYQSTLKDRGWVIADYAQRRALVEKQVNAQAATVNGHAVIDTDLLDEVTSLVEWPCALMGRFEERFLAVPSEALISSMKQHQKYFHLVDDNGGLMPYFITVANIESRDPAQVVAGNERVIRPRLADAAFFFAQDKQSTLTDARERLKAIVFQTELGTVWDKTERIAALAAKIAPQIGADASLCRRAGELCKSDLVSEMVLEFDDLQGTMGYHYALNDGENADVAAAMHEQYLPRHAGDQLPNSPVGIVVALADRIDTLTGIFGIGQPPTGSRDPFALRRAALGVLRICVEKQLTLDLRDVVSQAATAFSGLPKADSVVDDVCNYTIERFRSWFADDGIPVECFMAVQSRGITDPLDFARRIAAVNAFTAEPAAAALAAANKRVANILSKQAAGLALGDINSELLTEAAERTLAEAVMAMPAQLEAVLADSDYNRALTLLAGLREPVDAFFEQVLVMADDEAVRNNRFALLNSLRSLFLNVADISLLAVN